jgi:AcrR family transcriptional regulator
MPYPSQINPELVIQTASTLIEEHGIEQVSLARLAQELNVKAPSLYKYFADKSSLLKAVNTDTWRNLTLTMSSAISSTQQPSEQLQHMAKAYREYAHAHPRKYLLAFNQSDPTTLPDSYTLEALALPFQQVWAQAIGDAKSLLALRGTWALMHGFVALELSQKFQRGGDLDHTFEQNLQAYIRGWLV